jgi:hypothetical protein
LLLVLFFLVTGAWQDLAMHGIVFLVTLPLAVLGRHNRDWLIADLTVCLLFVLAIIVGLAGFPLDSSLLGLDKVFHVLGGVCCALIGVALLRGRVSGRWTFAITVVCVALAIGAAWEVFEWVLRVLGQMPTKDITYDDSMIDLIADGLGAAAVAWWRR